MNPEELRPPLSGRVLSADGRPVQGAEVTVDSWLFWPWIGPPTESQTVWSDADGRWRVDRQLKWGFWWIVPDAGPAPGQGITVRHGTDMLVVPAPRGTPRDARLDVTQDDLRLRVDVPSRWRGSRLLPVAGVLFGRGQGAAAYAGGMLVALHYPLRVGLRVAGEVGAQAAAVSGGLSLGFPFREVPGVNVDIAARAYRDWTPGAAGQTGLGPELGFVFGIVRLSFAWVRTAPVSPSTARGWQAQARVGLGYM